MKEESQVQRTLFSLPRLSALQQFYPAEKKIFLGTMPPSARTLTLEIGPTHLLWFSHSFSQVAAAHSDPMLETRTQGETRANSVQRPWWGWNQAVPPRSLLCSYLSSQAPLVHQPQIPSRSLRTVIVNSGKLRSVLTGTSNRIPTAGRVAQQGKPLALHTWRPPYELQKESMWVESTYSQTCAPTPTPENK